MNADGKKIGVALSGGGYRAAAYHIGTLRALKKLGILDNVDVISSVSGGSITAAYYALNKDDYNRFEDSFINALQHGVLTWAIVNLSLVVAFAVLGAIMIGWWFLLPELIFLLLGWYKLLPVSKWIERSYNKIFFHNKCLADLPDSPLVAINTTDVSSGKLFTFSQKKMVGYCYYKDGEKTISPFKHEKFPVSRAVMASSCVPFAFSPIKLEKEYRNDLAKSPMLIDGGLYDNQGTHKLSEEKSTYHADYIIVSDAGNTVLNSTNIFNPICLLIKTSDIMMDRIKRLQRMHNIYTEANSNRYAYVPLEWEIGERLITGFVDNLKKGNVKESLYMFHNIKEQDVEDLRNLDKIVSNDARNKIIAQLKVNIGWTIFREKIPSAVSYELARSVGTNLTKLCRRQIDALIMHAECLAEIQVRLYLPEIIINYE